MNWGGFGATIIVIIVGIYIAKRLKIPGGTIIVPMALGAAVQLSGTAPMTEKFKEVNEAYEVLSDEKKKAMRMQRFILSLCSL